jgi:hypothetical protein
VTAAPALAVHDDAPDQGQRGGPPAEGLHLLLSTVVFLAIAWLLLDWANA